MLATPVDAKPGKGKQNGKGNDKSDASHSQKENKGKSPNHPGKDGKAFQTNRIIRFKDTERDEIVRYFGR